MPGIPDLLGLLRPRLPLETSFLTKYQGFIAYSYSAGYLHQAHFHHVASDYLTSPTTHYWSYLTE